jgi:hypothetical protein
MVESLQFKDLPSQCIVLNVILCSWECPSPSTVVALGGLHEMLSMPEYGFIAILRDSVSCISDAEGSNKFGASFETPFGNRMV